LIAPSECAVKPQPVQNTSDNNNATIAQGNTNVRVIAITTVSLSVTSNIIGLNRENESGVTQG
jgi:hypothetical protein